MTKEEAELLENSINIETYDNTNFPFGMSYYNNISNILFHMDNDLYDKEFVNDYDNPIIILRIVISTDNINLIKAILEKYGFTFPINSMTGWIGITDDNRDNENNFLKFLSLFSNDSKS